MQQVDDSPRNDPAPSRWSYRFQRLMLTPVFRKVLRVGIPFCLTFGLVTAYFSDKQRQEDLVLGLMDLRQQFETRPEFMVQLLAVEGASADLQEDIRETFPYDLPASSFDLDLEEVRKMIAGLAPVADVSVRIRQGGVMVAEVTERVPVALWRSQDGLMLVDVEGVVIDEVPGRVARPELPLIAGEGADGAVPQALDILRAAVPLGQRVAGLVRVGERRWDVVLDREQRILLPTEQPVRALERVIVLAQMQDMLERDVVAVDMRLPGRPTIRMTEGAVEAWWQVTNMSAGAERQ